MAADDAIQARFEAAYRSSWPAVFRFALAWTNDQEAARDAAQDTFVRLWDRRARIDLGQDIVPLALTIERRLLTDRWRAAQRRMRKPFATVRLQPAWTPAVSDAWLDVQAAFARLTPVERVAISNAGIQVAAGLTDWPAPVVTAPAAEATALQHAAGGSQHGHLVAVGRAVGKANDDPSTVATASGSLFWAPAASRPC